MLATVSVLAVLAVLATLAVLRISMLLLPMSLPMSLSIVLIATSTIVHLCIAARRDARGTSMPV
jgi:hypothetical protein